MNPNIRHACTAILLAAVIIQNGCSKREDPYKALLNRMVGKWDRVNFGTYFDIQPNGEVQEINDESKEVVAFGTLKMQTPGSLKVRLSNDWRFEFRPAGEDYLAVRITNHEDKPHGGGIVVERMGADGSRPTASPPATPKKPSAEETQEPKRTTREQQAASKTEQTAQSESQPGTRQSNPITDLSYEIVGPGVKIIGYNESSPVVVIPGVIEAKPVTVIGRDAFRQQSKCTEVVLPSTLKTIEAGAFFNCRSLKSVAIPQGLERIEDSAFAGCPIPDFLLPASVAHFENALYGSPAVENISVDPANRVFKSIDGVLYDSQVTAILRCPEGRSKPVILPATIRTVGRMAFHGCMKLDALDLPDSVTSIGAMAFYGCTGLKQITIPAGVKKLEPQTFAGCSQLESVALSDSLESIGGGVFWGCGKLHTLKVPASATSIDAEAFENCPAKIAYLRLAAVTAGGEPVIKGGTPRPVTAATTRGESSVNQRTVEHLSPKAARSLTAAAGALLSLPRLRGLSEETAHELATYRDESGTCTYTVCVPVTEEQTATYTVMVPYTEEETLEDGKKVPVTKSLPQLRTRTYTVTVCVPEERTHKCPLTLQLDGLVSVEPGVLVALAKHDGNLHLGGLKSLTADEAKSLAVHKGGTLALNGLDSLDTEVAAQLATHQDALSLNGVSMLSAETAEALCKNNVALTLNGIKVLTDELATVFAKQAGSISLLGVTQASDEAVRLLANKPVSLPTTLVSAKATESEEPRDVGP